MLPFKWFAFLTRTNFVTKTSTKEIRISILYIHHQIIHEKLERKSSFQILMIPNFITEFWKIVLHIDLNTWVESTTYTLLNKMNYLIDSLCIAFTINRNVFENIWWVQFLIYDAFLQNDGIKSYEALNLVFYFLFNHNWWKWWPLPWIFGFDRQEKELFGMCHARIMPLRNLHCYLADNMTSLHLHVSVSLIRLLCLVWRIQTAMKNCIKSIRIDAKCFQK